MKFEVYATQLKRSQILVVLDMQIQKQVKKLHSCAGCDRILNTPYHNPYSEPDKKKLNSFTP